MKFNKTELSACSTANRNYFEFMYSVECAVIGFDTSYARNPLLKKISLTPFSGCLAKEIKEAVEKYNKEKMLLFSIYILWDG